MKKRIIERVHICFAILSLCGDFSVYGQAIIWGELSEQVTLPCSFAPGDNVVIHWTIGQSKKVHTYYNGTDQLEHQDVEYKGRTSLFLSEVNRGNASLKITNVQGSDEEEYTCYVGTKDKVKQSKVKLGLAVFKQQSINYEAQDKEIHLSCNVNNSFPANSTNIRWYQNGNIHKERVASSSSLNITNHTDVVQCVIEHKLLNTHWTGSWEMTEHYLTGGQSLAIECKLCRTINTNVSVTWLLRKAPQETGIAILDSATNTLKATEKYNHRIKRGIDANRFSINDLTEEDNGDYVCVITETKGMHINVTSLYITNKSGNYALIIGLVIPTVVILTYAILFWIAKIKKQTRGL